jgi:hypothetical protein
VDQSGAISAASVDVMCIRRSRTRSNSPRSWPIGSGTPPASDRTSNDERDLLEPSRTTQESSGSRGARGRHPHYDPPLIANDGPAVVGPLEPTAIADLAQALADAIATVGRQLHEDQELQLRSLLEKIESRLDELLAASREPLPIAPNERQSGPIAGPSRTGTASNGS